MKTKKKLSPEAEAARRSYLDMIRFRAGISINSKVDDRHNIPRDLVKAWDIKGLNTAVAMKHQVTPDLMKP